MPWKQDDYLAAILIIAVLAIATIIALYYTGRIGTIDSLIPFRHIALQGKLISWIP